MSHRSLFFVVLLLVISLCISLCSGQDYSQTIEDYQYINNNNANPSINQVPPTAPTSPPMTPPTTPPAQPPQTPPAAPPATCQAEDYLCETIKVCWPCRPQPGQTQLRTTIPLCGQCQSLMIAEDEAAQKKAACSLCKALGTQTTFIPSYCALTDVRALC